MLYSSKYVRPGMTAIAAVLAMSSTPLLAQEFTPLPASPAPAAQPAPAPARPLTATPFNPEPVAAPAQRSTAERSAGASQRQARSAAAERRASAPARTASAAPAPRTAPPAETVAPVAAAPAAAPMAAAPEASVVAPVAPPALQMPAAQPAAEQTQTVTWSDTDTSDLLPIAGAAGAGILLLGGGAALMLSRRRRREEQELDRQEALEPTYAAPPPEPVMAPVAAAPAMAMEPTPAAERPEFATAPAAAVPAGMDISRFGRHVQAAYRGPTPDNPSLSLKRRLKRAAFFDMRERQALEQGEQIADERAPAFGGWNEVERAPEEVSARAGARARRNGGALTGNGLGYRPAFQN